MLSFKESSKFQWSCPSPWEHLCCIFSQTSGGHWACHAMDKVTQRAPDAQWLRWFQLLLDHGKELSFRMEQFPKLPKLGNAAHHAGSTQVSTKLKFSINCCVIGECNMTSWEPSFLANILERNNCTLLTVAHSLSCNSSLVLPCRRAIWEFVFIF